MNPMAIARFPIRTEGRARRVGIVLSRFNAEIGDGLLAGAMRALRESGVADEDALLVEVPGALETPLALQRMAQSGDFDALVALGAVIRGETYHFEVVSNESSAGIARVSLEESIPVANAVLTTETDEQAEQRAPVKGAEAAQVAVEMANLAASIDSLSEVPEVDERGG